MKVMKGLTAALVAFMGLLTIPLAGTGQSRPLGPGGSGDLRATLGDCPVAALRAAWGDMMPLEAIAVEAEVLRLCTERAEAINRFLAMQVELDAAVAGLHAPARTLRSSTPSEALALIALRDENDTLRARIKQLETDPGTTQNADSALNASSAAVDTVAQPTPGRADNGPPRLPLGTPGILAGAPAAAATTRTEWQVLYTVRAAEGHWRAAFLGVGGEFITLRDGIEQDLRTEWRSTVEGPFIGTIGDMLPDGQRIAAITEHGVQLSAGGTPSGDSGPTAGLIVDSTPVAARWREAGNAATPGRIEWMAIPIKKDAP